MASAAGAGRSRGGRGSQDEAIWTDAIGAQHAIPATADAISHVTALYSAVGQRRTSQAIARRVELQVKGLPVAGNCALIDLPGLRDTAELDRLAPKIAGEADLVLWLYRSEPALSEQDVEGLAYLVANCGAHVVQLALNAYWTKTSYRAWRWFRRQCP